MDGVQNENPIKMDDLKGPPLFLETPILVEALECPLFFGWKNPPKRRLFLKKNPKPINFQGLQGIRLMLPEVCQEPFTLQKKWGAAEIFVNGSLPFFVFLLPFF